MDLSTTIHHLQNLLGNPASPEYQQSWEFISGFRSSDLPSFLGQMTEIFPNQELFPPLRQLSIILSYQCFPCVLEKSNIPIPPLNLPSDLITRILSTTSNCFSDQFENIRISAATYFSRIGCIDVLTNDSFQITKTLISGFSSPSSPESFQCFCFVLIDLLTATVLDDEELSVILTALFNYLSANLETIPGIMKKYCLKILRVIINNMGDVLGEENNAKNLFQALFAMSQIPETKSEAFCCWIEITINYYPMLEQVAQQLIESSFIELAQDENDNETLINICVFWLELSGCEMYKNEELHIINQVAQTLLPLLMKISVKAPLDQCDNEEDYEPHIVAAKAIQNIVALAPIESTPVLVNFISQFSSAAGSENFGLREGALNSLNFLIQFADCSPFLIDSLGLIYNGLNDNSPRVRQAAVYCVHAILISILTKGDMCPFAELIPQIGLKIVHLSMSVMNQMVGNIDVMVASTAAKTLADLIRFPGFPYVGRALSLLLNASINVQSSNSLNLSICSFSSLQYSVGKCPVQFLHPLMGAILGVMKHFTYVNPDFWIINNLCRVLQVIYVRIAGQIDQASFQLSWELFEATFHNYPSDAFSLIVPLSTLGMAAGQMFSPYLEQSIGFIMNGLNNYEMEETIPSAAHGVSLLCDAFDLSPYAAGLFQSMANAVQSEIVPLQSKAFLADAIGNLAQKCQEQFKALLPSIMGPISLVCENVIGDIIAYTPEDIDEAEFDFDDVMIAFLKCLQKALIVLSTPPAEDAFKVAECLNDLLEKVGGMKEHGDELLMVSVKAMASLINIFPDFMKENLDNEPGFIEIIQEATAAEVALPEIQMITSFMSS